MKDYILINSYMSFIFILISKVTLYHDTLIIKKC